MVESRWEALETFKNDFQPFVRDVTCKNSLFSTTTVSKWYPFKRISLKLRRFLVERGEYSAFCIVMYVLLGSKKDASPDPSIILVSPEIVFKGPL